MAAKIRKLEPQVQKILQQAACIGNRFELSTLARVSDTLPEVCAIQCWTAVQNNLLLPVGDNYKLLINATHSDGSKTREQPDDELNIHYRFAHDRIQQAAYSLLPEEQKAKIHLTIGRLLKQQSKGAQTQDELFHQVSQLNAGQVLITEPQKRIELAGLNLQAGASAKRATAYEAARRFYQTGLGLLDSHDNEKSWQTEYQLTLNLTEGATEVAFLLGDYSQQQHYSDTLLNHSRTLMDSIKTHQLHCLSQIAQDKPLEAINYALPILKLCGIDFPGSPGPDDFQRELAKTQALLGDRPIASLIDLPLMSEPKVLAGVRLLEKLNVALYVATPVLFPIAIFKQVQLAIEYGNAPEIVPFYGAYGFLLSGIVNDIDNGYEFGLLALALLDKLQAQAQKSLTYVNIYGPNFFKKPIRESITPLRQSSQSGLETGDLHFAAASLLWANAYAYFSGVELPELTQKLTRDELLITGIHQDVCLGWSQMLHQVILNLLGEAKEVIRLKGAVYDESLSLEQYQQAGDRFAIGMMTIHQMILAYLFQDKQQALKVAEQAKDYLEALTGTLYVPLFHFYNALINLACYPEQSVGEQAKSMACVLTHQDKMHFWAQHAPMNFQHKWALVEAERYRVLGDNPAAEDCYDTAIEGAAEFQFPQEEALACELAGRFYLSRKKHMIAQTYLTRAYYAWARWGAKAKTRQLENLYPNHLEMLAHNTSNNRGKATNDTQSSSSSHRFTSEMDLNSVIKSSQALSSELDLAALLNKLLNLLMKNAGAQRTVLLLNEASEDPEKMHWYIAAESFMASESQKIMHNIPLAQYEAIPLALLQTVMEQKQAIVIDDASEPYQSYYSDPYFAQDREQKSILCQPVLAQGRLLGLLYLENKLTTHVFHEKRLQLIQIMAAQAAISIENAQLYENLEDKVKERTRELKEAQTKLVEHARKAGMADIASNVMHTIGNRMQALKVSTGLLNIAIKENALRKQFPMYMKFMESALEPEHQQDEEMLAKAHKMLQILPGALEDEYQQIESQMNNSEELLRHIEEFVHLQSKYTHIKPMLSTVDINQLINDALKMLDGTLQREHIQVSLNLMELPLIQIEEHQILPIIMNVINYASHNMSMIPIKQRHLYILSDKVDSFMEAEGPLIKLSFKDSGKGFDTLQIKTFFAPLHSPQSVSKNTDMDFHAMANYLKAQDGGIQVESEGLEKGANISLYLPMK